MKGIPIRLTEERWFHIAKHHPELKRLRRLVSKTVTKPDRLFFFAAIRDFAAVAKHSELLKLGIAPNLVVHYKEVSDQDGFIVTAFPISEWRMRRKFGNWQRLR